ncbi:MAG: tetratricopeptide repeat protein [Phototrophicaceae bacterium]
MADFVSYEAPAHEATSLPVMLPGKLVGRDDALKTIYAYLKQNRPVWLHGQSGVGKTAIAATLASAFTQKPGGTLWLSVDEDSLSSLIVRVGRAYGIMEIANSENPLGMIGAVATTLMQNKPFIILDGNPLMPAVVEFVNRVAVGLPMLIVSEETTRGTWAEVEIKPLALADAVSLFQERSGLNGEGVVEVVKLLDQSPLAIIMVAGVARVSKLDLSTLLEKLNSATESDAVHKAIKVSFASLQSALQGILLMLGATLDGGASLEMLTLISDAGQESVQKVMTILTAIGLTSQTLRYNEPYYQMHPMLHQFIQTYLDSNDRLTTLQEKVVEATLKYAEKYANAEVRSHNKLAIEMNAFLAVAYWTAQRGRHDAVSRLVVALTQASGFINSRGFLYEVLQLQEAGSSGVSAFPANAQIPPEVLDNPSILDDFEDDEEADMSFLVDDDEDFDDEDVTEDEDAPTPLSTFAEDYPPGATTMVSTIDLERRLILANELVEAGKTDDALKMFDTILQRLDEGEDEDPQLELKALKAMTQLLVKKGDYQPAILNAIRGVKLAETQNNAETLIKLLSYLGDARQQLGETGEAILTYQRALKLSREKKFRQDEVLLQTQLAFAQLDDEATDDAITNWEDALKLSRELALRQTEGKILGGLGTAYAEQKRWEEALSYYNSALHIAREQKDATEEMLQLSNLAYASVEANKLGDAVLRYRQALHLSYQSENKKEIVNNLVDLARLLAKSVLHLKIAELLVKNAAEYDAHDREVVELGKQIAQAISDAEAKAVQFKHLSGSARLYAEAAYKLLDAS